MNEEFEDDLRQNVKRNSYGTISSDEIRSSGIVVPTPVIPTSPHLQTMSPPSNLIAGIAQAMAAAAAASAVAASSRYNPLSQTTSLYNKSSVSESVTTVANSLLRANASLTSPYIPPGFPLSNIGARQSFLGKCI